MKKIFELAITSLFIFGCAAIVPAQEGPPPPPPMPQGGGRQMQMQMPAFSDLDKNKDKKLSKDEFPAQMPAQMFDRMDDNKDGFVDENEWNTSMTRFRGGPGGGGGPRISESLTKFMDANTDGKVSHDEFAVIVRVFEYLDKDKNGELTQEEMGQFMQAVNQAATEVQNKATGGVDVNQLFTNLDKNKDGKLTPDEVSSEKTFKALDLNKDATVTKEEATESLKKQAERSQKSQQKPPQQ
jgi:Ca2+-binding EF-hand superfamily protein